MTKDQQFEDDFKQFLGKEFNSPLDINLSKDGMFVTEDEGSPHETMEEKRIIMEMYNRDNREKRLKQVAVKTALTKHPLVPRMSKKNGQGHKSFELPLLKDMRKHDNKQDVLPPRDLRERLHRHRIYIRGLKVRLNEYKIVDPDQEKSDMFKRLNAFMASRGKSKKNHIRTISKP